ncbi:MAG: ArnT family glycosyltransferase [Anaerolineales bacterium]
MAGILWAREPLRPSFFMVGPTQPNNAYYPFSDSASFDTSSQYALIGQGIRNGEVFDRPGYIAWLTLLHVLIGQNFESLAALQAGIFGVLPAIIYLLGKEIHSRSLGVTAAAITAFRGINSIAASNLIDLASPKMLLTDFPTAIGMALFTLLVLHWLKRPAERPHNALAAGCALGLSILLRTNALLMLPGILIFALFSINRDAQVKTKHRLPKPNITRIRKSYWKEWLLGAMLVISGMLVTTLPWDLRNYSKGAPMFYLYFARIQSVIEQRYRQPLEEIPYEDPRNNYSDREIPGKKPMFTISPHPATDFRIETAAQLRTCSSLTCSISNHFLHNLVTSILIFPASLQLDDLFNTVKAGVPLWGPDWDGGGLGPVGFALIALNLAVLSLGVGGSWQRQRWLGLTPFTVYLVYTLSNALARTSGGRYLVPVDWVVVLYFNLGAILLVQWAVSLIDGTIAKSPRPRGVEHSVPTRSRTAQLPAMLFMIVLIGSLIPLSEIVFPRRYADDLASESMLALLHERQRQTLFQHIGIDPTVGIESFLQSNPEVRFLIGRALYPRFSRLDLPPLSFTLIGPSGTSGVVLPSGPIASFPHAGDVLVFGCQRAEYLEVFAVFVLDDADGSYLRSPSVPLEC